MTNNGSRVILDLCSGTGSWSKPYAEAGYDVRYVTLPEWDVRDYVKMFKHRSFAVHGILAAPPCEHFSSSGAQYWKQKDLDGRTSDAISIVSACVEIVGLAAPVWWALENPVGRLPRILGKYKMIFQPWEFGDPWTKKTCLWGEFTPPEKCPVKPIRYTKQGSWTQRYGGKSERTKQARSITPPGFAKAFFEANP